MIWFTSDLHFGHQGAIEYCKRPFNDVGEMAAHLIKRWNHCVKITDTVYVLGDMALCSPKEFEPIAFQLNGRKFLIKGNHDHFSNGAYERFGFTVLHEVKMKLGGHTVRLSHYPYRKSRR